MFTLPPPTTTTRYVSQQWILFYKCLRKLNWSKYLLNINGGGGGGCYGSGGSGSGVGGCGGSGGGGSDDDDNDIQIKEQVLKMEKNIVEKRRVKQEYWFN